MNSTVRLYSEQIGEISKFINSFFNIQSKNTENNLIWEKKYDNPIEITDIIGVFIDNKDKFNINMWINIDDDVYINISETNADDIIRYMFERFPY